MFSPIRLLYFSFHFGSFFLDDPNQFKYLSVSLPPSCVLATQYPSSKPTPIITSVCILPESFTHTQAFHLFLFPFLLLLFCIFLFFFLLFLNKTGSIQCILFCMLLFHLAYLGGRSYLTSIWSCIIFFLFAWIVFNFECIIISLTFCPLLFTYFQHFLVKAVLPLTSVSKFFYTDVRVYH